MIEQLFGTNWGEAIFVVLNLIVIESLLSVDNAAVLASMVQDLPSNQRQRALRYGIIGAYVFRGLCLLFAAWLVQILWLKIAGGAYLIWLAWSFFRKKADGDADQDSINKQSNRVFKFLHGTLGLFWTTVVLVELMDLTFSIDNIFAAVAFSDKIGLICIGVFIGILAMRFIAGGFIKLMERYPVLEPTTFVVIAILGVKLMLSGICDYLPGNPITPILNAHYTDVFFSIGIMMIFFLPIMFKRAPYGK